MHKVLVVSRDALNNRMKIVVADLTSTQRDRAFPTTVRVEPSPVNGLTKTTFILCHDLATVDRGRLGLDPIGRLSVEELDEVNEKLKIVLDFAPLAPPPKSDA